MSIFMSPWASDFAFQEDQAEAIIRAAAYCCKDIDRAVIWFSPRYHGSVRKSIAAPFQRDPHASLGSLDRLPNEILHDVLLYMNMQPLFRFRQTNRRARQMVASLKQYQIVTSHGLNLICALLRTGLARDVSLSDFYNILCTKECSVCGRFGGFVSLLTWSRCCFVCLKWALEMQVQTLHSAWKQFQLTKPQLRQLKSFKTIPGEYSMEKTLYNSRLTLVSTRQVLSIAGQQPDERILGGRNRNVGYMGSCALPYCDPRTGKVDHGVSYAQGCEILLSIST